LAPGEFRGCPIGLCPDWDRGGGAVWVGALAVGQTVGWLGVVVVPACCALSTAPWLGLILLVVFRGMGLAAVDAC